MMLIAGILIGILLLLLFPVRLVALAESDIVPTARLHYLFFSMCLYPRPKEEKMTEKVKKEKAGKKPEREWVPLLSELLSRFDQLARPVQTLLRRTGLVRFSLRIVVVGEDAAQTALRFGKTNAVVFAGVAALDRIVTLRVKHIEIIPGFTAERETYSLSGELRVIPLAALLAAASLGFWILFAALRSAATQKERKDQMRKSGNEGKSAIRKEECNGKQASY